MWFINLRVRCNRFVDNLVKRCLTLSSSSLLTIFWSIQTVQFGHHYFCIKSLYFAAWLLLQTYSFIIYLPETTSNGWREYRWPDKKYRGTLKYDCTIRWILVPLMLKNIKLPTLCNTASSQRMSTVSVAKKQSSSYGITLKWMIGI